MLEIFFISPPAGLINAMNPPTWNKEGVATRIAVPLMLAELVKAELVDATFE